MMKPRRAREEGHRRKLLVVIDGTPECERALFYAAKRAERTGDGLVLVHVIVPDRFGHWLGVEAVMREEAREEAQALLSRFAEKILRRARVEPELVIREGKRVDEVRALIDEDEDIVTLILAAGETGEGPGPLVTAVAGRASPFPIPVVVIPATLDDETIEAIA